MFHAILKPLIVIGAGLQALFYALANMLNFESALGFVWLVLGQSQNDVYPGAAIPAMSAEWMVLVTLLIIIALELAGGILAILGGVRMLLAQAAPPPQRERARDMAATGLGLMVLCWFGLFLGIAAAGMGMWQTEAGANAQAGAFVYGGSSALILLILLAPERLRNA